MNSVPEKVLVVAEEASQRYHLRRTLNASGFDLGEASNGVHALMRLRMIDYEAVLLHSSESEADGIEVCRQLRNFNPRLPVLMLSDRDSLDHLVAALETGADDYMIKPVAERELTARLRSAIRRYRAPLVPPIERLVVRDIVLDPTAHRVEKSGAEIPLTPLEFRALHILMEQAGIPVTHATLLTTLWSPERAQRREHLRVLIGGLRKKLENDAAHPEYLITHPHLGYFFAAGRPNAGSPDCRKKNDGGKMANVNWAADSIEHPVS
jgi:two-component system, OmpR family, KDP operon response regulator KdpE